LLLPVNTCKVKAIFSFSDWCKIITSKKN